MLIRRKTMMSTVMHDVNVIQTHTNLVSSRVVRYNSYTASVVCDEGYSIYEITIKMGGVDITSTAYDPTYNMISIASVTGDVDIECYAMHTMPSDYIRVDGIKNPSNAYLDTGYKCSSNNRLELSFVLVWPQPTVYDYIGTNGHSANIQTSGWRIFMNTNPYYSGYVYAHIGGGDGSEIINTGLRANSSTLNKTHLLISDFYKKEYYADGNKVTTTKSKSSTDTNDFCLYSSRSGYYADRSAGQIVHHFKIYDYSTTSYVRYYIPCLNDSGVAGFWDAARGVFQGSSNSTAFEAVAADGGDFRLINFEDSAVKNICVTNWGGHYKAGEMYTPEARAVTSLGNKFENNKDIVKFNEMQYFTGLTTLSRYVSSQYLEGGNYFGAFNRCSNLEEVTLPTISIQGDTRIAGLFLRCTSLKTIDMSPITVTSGANLYSICRGCTSLTSAILPSVTVSASYIHFMYAFDVCSNITTIDASNVIFTADNANNSASFAGCSKLTRIIGGLSGWKQTNNMSACPLTHDAAVELLESLGTVTSARTITLKTSTYNTLTAEELAIATGKGWTVAKG